MIFVFGDLEMMLLTGLTFKLESNDVDAIVDNEYSRSDSFMPKNGIELYTSVYRKKATCSMLNIFI